MGARARWAGARLQISDMPLRVRDHLYWCVSGGRTIFLDLESDRYFCLPQRADDAFMKALQGRTEIDAVDLQQLVEEGILTDVQASAASRTKAAIPTAASDYPIDPSQTANAREMFRMLWNELIASLVLRFGTMRHAVEHWSTQTLSPHVAADPHQLAKLARAAADASLLLRATDRCLVRALAVHRLCRRRGLATRLVFGVRTNPFGAHAWVQYGEQVIVGEFEQARLYTPIAAFG